VGPIGTLVFDNEYKKGARASSNALVALPRPPWAVIPATDPVGTGRDLSLQQIRSADVGISSRRVAYRRGGSG